MTATVEVDCKPRSRRLWNAAELIEQSLRLRAIELAERIDGYRAVTSRVFGADREGSVHGNTCKLALSTDKLRSAWLIRR